MDNKENLLTVVVVTYNRFDLLTQALSSLEHQHDRSFDVLIFDNGSTDSTPNIIQMFLGRNLNWRSVRIETNLYSTSNIRYYAEQIHTPWVTYLCDDDFLRPDYMTYALPVLQGNSYGVICFGHATCSAEGKVLNSYIPVETKLDTRKALGAWRTNLLPETAGMTGFIFHSSLLSSVSWDYPGGFFNDTRLGLEAVSAGGIMAIPQCTVVRRVWHGSFSSGNSHTVLKRLNAHLQFIRDIEKKGVKYRVPLEKERRLLRNPIAFFRNYGLALLDGDTCKRGFLKAWWRFALSCPLWLRIRCFALIPVLIVNHGKLKVLQRVLRRRFRRKRVLIGSEQTC